MPVPERAGAPSPPVVPADEPADQPADQPAPSEGRSSKRRLFVVACALVVTALVAGVVVDVVAQVQLHDARSAAQKARSDLATSRQDVRHAVAALRLAIANRDSNQGALDAADQELLAAKADLSSSDADAGAQSTDITVTDQCLDGVDRALEAVNTGEHSSVLADLSSASSSCLSLEGQGGGPVYPFDFPDPYLLTDGGTTYAYGTNSATGNIQMLESTDLTHWTPVGDALPHLPTWAVPGNTWAPAVLQVGTTFVLYYTVQAAGDGDECISAATSTSPTGPFVDDSSAPLVCQTSLGGSIDPDAFVDDSGHPYLLWKSVGTTDQAPTIWSQALAPGGTALGGGSPAPLVTPTQPWEAGIVEAPAMAVVDGQYDLLFSGNDWSSSRYAIGLATCSAPTGPCTVTGSGPILASQTGFSGPGGPAVFQDAGGQWWVAFAAYLPQAVGYPNSRLLFLRKLGVTSGQLSVAAGG
jgi:hypothetical protein